MSCKEYTLDQNLGNFYSSYYVINKTPYFIGYSGIKVCNGSFQYCLEYNKQIDPVAIGQFDNSFSCFYGSIANWLKRRSRCISDPWRLGQLYSEFITVKGWVNPNAPIPSDSSGCSKRPEGIALDNSNFSYIVSFSDVKGDGTILNETNFLDVYPFNVIGTALWVDQSRTKNDTFIVLTDIWGLVKGILQLTADVEGRKTYNCTFRTIGITTDGDDYVPLNVKGQIQIDTLRNEVVNVIVTGVFSSLSENTFTASIRNITGESWIPIREGRRAFLIFNDHV